MHDSEHLITSEVHPFTERDSAEPLVSSENVVSRFTFTFPSDLKKRLPRIGPSMDEDGDYLIQRKNECVKAEGSILIEHSISTTLGLVGEQVWRGALLLADFILHCGSSLLKGKIALELGSGTGLSGIVSALYCSEVICTDLDKGNILDIIRINGKRNEPLTECNGGKVTVEELDFFDKNWNEPLKNNLMKASIILAADVIYDNDLTEAFVDTLSHLMLSGNTPKIAYLSMEKRYVFTVADLESVAPCYEHFLECLKQSPLWPYAKCLPIDFPQYFNYERGKDLVLWEIKSPGCI